MACSWFLLCVQFILNTMMISLKLTSSEGEDELRDGV